MLISTRKFNKPYKHNKLSFQRKIRTWFLRGSTIFKILAATIIYLLIFTTHLNFVTHYIKENFYEFAADVGFKLKTVIIKGNSHVDSKQIINALNADVGTPLFAISLSSAYSKLKENNWIDTLSIMRKLPNTIVIHILEKKPIAIWQHQQALSLIDSEGAVIEKVDKENTLHLLHVVGSDANLHAEQLLSNLKTQPIIMNHVISAVRYGDRRWNLILTENITVKMPELDFNKALSYLAKLSDQNKLFSQSYKILDLRDQNKYYFEK